MKAKRVIGVTLAAVLLTTSFAGCGKSSNESVSTSDTESNGKYKDTITVDVFDDQANVQGIQTGWFAKIVKDKFNMELNIIAPNVAGGGDTIYQTRSANGNLGDLIITKLDQSRLKDMVSAGLLLDMTDYLSDAAYLNQYASAIEDASTLAEQDGMWAVPSEISNQSATEPCDAIEPTNAPSLRWDLYGEIGYPKMDTLEDLLDVLAQMQEKAGKSDSGKDVYALSLFKDWDGDNMQNAAALCSLYGYESIGFAMSKADGSDIQSIIDDGSMYVRSLKFLYQANQMGLVDPESTTQNFDTLKSKYKDGGVLYSLWPWLGAGQKNTSENTTAGKGFATATIGDMECLTYGSMPEGKMGVGIMVGSQAQDPQRMVDFINWLYSPEGIEAGMAGNGLCGPEGLTWEMKDGEPVFTDYGVQALVDQSSVAVPEEWGTGTFTDGWSALNFKAVGLVDTDPDTGMCYNYQRWDDYLERTLTKLSEDWSAHNGDAKSAIEYLDANNYLMVLPGTNYATPEYETDISTIKEQCKASIVEYSWKMIFAGNDDEFNSLLKELQDTVNGLGYQQVYAVDKQNCEDKQAEMQEAVKASD